MKNSIFRNQKYIRWLVLVIWLVIWYVAAHLVGSGLILPGPHATLMALLKLVKTKTFYFNVLWTLLRTVIGIAVSFVLGAAFAVLADRSMPVREFLRLPVNFFKSIPVMAIIIYLILVLESGHVAVAVCFLMCFPIAYTNILNGLDGMDGKFDELARIYGMTPGQRRALIVRPLLKPEIKSAADLIAGMSWKVVVASEVLAIPGHSIGYQMLNSKYYLETPDLFAYIIVLIVLSLAAERLASFLADIDYRDTGKRVREEVAKAVASYTADADDTDDTAVPVIVTLDNVTKSYVSDDGTRKIVFSGLNMELMHGIVAILGPSGEGKTTVARLIMGLEKPDDGTVKIEPYMTPDVLFQEDRLLPWLTAEENMMLAFIGHRTYACRDKKPYEAIHEMAKKLEISDVLGSRPDELSGGMAHRAALGRALLGGSRLLILDEPMRGIDAGLKKRLTARLDEYIRRSRSGEDRIVIMITHDEKLAEELADTFIRM